MGQFYATEDGENASSIASFFASSKRGSLARVVFDTSAPHVFMVCAIL